MNVSLTKEHLWWEEQMHVCEGGQNRWLIKTLFQWIHVFPLLFLSRLLWHDNLPMFANQKQPCFCAACIMTCPYTPMTLESGSTISQSGPLRSHAPSKATPKTKTINFLSTVNPWRRVMKATRSWTVWPLREPQDWSKQKCERPCWRPSWRESPTGWIKTLRVTVSKLIDDCG